MTISFFGTKGDYSCFSNFHRAPFQDAQGSKYSYSEQYFMKKKQELFDPLNRDLANAIMTSQQIKMLGRKVKNKAWNENRYEVMITS